MTSLNEVFYFFSEEPDRLKVKMTRLYIEYDNDKTSVDIVNDT